ncbi:hypothetical protein DTO013E5_1109 [Penicillium roqueforti]|nr:uncharacterized protein LCP9604111_1864 [Penicillium roqueforti]KAF9251868.1 hypothetical protein LCP9604111_1864 [Penicillium roqueforti]KAI1836319.1 hypothetical protein CBS147337_2546 [Penicillium roqueforti]KAI2687573.1 hypothetical protein LCP963914a_3091 [Penicillium roqueforti]KAI2690079.1 hypothetical protein CBS147355_530 [Penicillium roqueforti]KAI2702595.1 hypothetical protein CBS147372_4328 [Penicillium roqueforti]
MPQDALQELLQEVSSEWTTPQDRFLGEPQFWIYYSSGPGVTVKGWPSQGGIYTLDVSSRVEIEFLELDPFNNTRRPTNSDPNWQQKENAHCDRMRYLSPTWWPTELAWLESGMSGMLDERSNNYVRVGWTSDGGAWVWKTTKEGASKKGGAMLQNARTMEERCLVIERLGGTFYANPKYCPFLDLP